MSKAFLSHNIEVKKYLDNIKIHNKIYHKLINPSGEVIAGLCRPEGMNYL
jgi:hypothetical protein